MNGIFTFRRSDELSLNLKLDGATALDCSYMGKSLLFADSSDYIRLNIESGDVVRRKRSTHKIVRILKCHPRIVNNFVAIAGSNVEFWQNFTLNSCISKTTRILDFDFNYFQENLSVVSSAESVTLIDSRVPKQPSNSLPLLFGASQAKFSPATEYLLYTAHVSDIRCFDIRNARAPCRQFVASSHKRQILSMALHPTDSNILVSSSSSESKLWNCSDSNAQPYHLDHSNIGKFAFCNNGELFVGINYASANKPVNSVKLWQISALGNAQELQQGVSCFIDMCWLKNDQQNLYLFTMSKNNSIFKHLIVPNVQNEAPTMREPIKQTAEDVKIDRLALSSPIRSLPNQGRNNQNKRDADSLIFDSNSKSWNCWLRAPNQQGEVDLLFELNSVRKLSVLGLACNEINFQRAAIGLSYSHFGIYKKIVIEIRFHRNFLENGLVFVELIKKDSPLNNQSAKSLFYRINDECEKQQSRESSISVLARTLRQLPTIVDSIQLFPPVNQETLDQHRLSLLINDNLEKPSTGKDSQCSFGCASSPIDSFVPSPRLSGARFNRNGILALFGQIECTFNLKSDEKTKLNEDSKNSRSLYLKGSRRTVTPQEDPQISLKKPPRIFNRHESIHNQPLFIRTLSDYHSCAMDRSSHDLPETNHSFTIFNSTETPSELENRHHLSSITLEECGSMSTSIIKSNKNATVMSPIRRRRGISMTSCVTADSFPIDHQPTNSVTILDTTIFQNVSKILGSHYRLIGASLSKICYHNIWVIVRYAPHKRELIALWQILFEFFNAYEEHQRRKQDKEFSFHPLDYQFIYYFIEYFYVKWDIQTAALLCGVLFRFICSLKTSHKEKKERADKLSPTNSAHKMAIFDRYVPLFMAKDSEKKGEQILLHKKMREFRLNKHINVSETSSINNSTRNSFEQRETLVPVERHETVQMCKPKKVESSQKIVDEYHPYLTLSKPSQPEIEKELKERLKSICLEYGVILWQWGYLNQRAELLKCIETDINDATFIQLMQCLNCNAEKGYCDKCEAGSIVCIVCDQLCNGLITVCKTCGHGGHLNHISEYFAIFDSCPCCGCRCRN